jgi:hypothetical protein
MLRLFDTEPILTKSRCKKFHSLHITYIMNLNRILLIIFATLSLQISFAQSDFKPGHIVTLEGDTLRGLINLKSKESNGTQCEFKDENGELHIYLPFEIQEYEISNLIYYVSKSIPLYEIQRDVFLEYLVDGIADLYFYHDNGKDFFYLEKNEELHLLSNEPRTLYRGTERYEVNSKAYVGTMSHLFRDSPNLQNKIKNTPYSPKSLVKITKEYHQSINSSDECIDYTKKPSPTFFIEPFVFLAQSRMKNELSVNNYYFTDNQKGIGANIKLIPFRAHSQINYLLGINFSKFHYSGIMGIKEKYGPRNYQLDIQYNCLKVPLMLQYTLPTKKIIPFVMLGFNNVFLLNYNVNAAYKLYPLEETYNMPVDQTGRLKKYQIGFLACIGAKYQISESKYIFTSSNFEYRKQLFDTGSILDSHSEPGIQLTFGYGFKL